MYLSDGGIVVVVSDGGVVILCGGLGQLHRFGRTQLMHAPCVSSVISLLTVVRKELPIPVIISLKNFTSFRNLGCRLHASSGGQLIIFHTCEQSRTSDAS